MIGWHSFIYQGRFVESVYVVEGLLFSFDYISFNLTLNLPTVLNGITHLPFCWHCLSSF